MNKIEKWLRETFDWDKINKDERICCVKFTFCNDCLLSFGDNHCLGGILEGIKEFSDIYQLEIKEQLQLNERIMEKYGKNKQVEYWEMEILPEDLV